jgi:hypothetical protein
LNSLPAYPIKRPVNRVCLPDQRVHERDRVERR